MDAALRFVAEITRASRVERGSTLQRLWSGYGELFRVHVDGAERATVIVKWVRPPRRENGGGESERSHARKLRSYDVENEWYRRYAERCDDTCRVPALVGCRAAKDERLLVLEDLDEAGFDARHRRGREGASAIGACLAWLAAFHARFLGVSPVGLWKTGTYWHLATRPDELAAMDDDALRAAAPILDRMLEACTHKTLVHGDAKLPNFCFSRRGDAVAAVDFQYVGGGCGMKDVAYLLAGEPDEERHLDRYFRLLRQRLDPSIDADALEAEWRALYPVACVDFYRFLAGWAKDSYRHDAHAQRLTRSVLASLRSST